MFPNLPTDNLYKFVALSGVVIFIFSIYYPVTVEKEIMKNAFDMQQHNASIKERIKWINQENDLMSMRNERILRILKEKGALLNAEITFLKSVSQRDNAIVDYHKNQELKNKLDELLVIESKLNSEAESYQGMPMETGETKESIQFSFLIGLLTPLCIVCMIMLLIGMAMMGWGFYMWYIKVQRPLDTLLDKELDGSKNKLKRKLQYK